jgi:hypothetical protein
MYSRFGLPDEDRDWESFFYGVEKETASTKGYSRNNGSLREYVEMDLSEGKEEMILIQDLEMPKVVEEVVEETSTVIPVIPTEDIPTHTTDNIYHFSIKSKTFNSSKYFIEENENGFFIVNARNQNKMLLTTMKTMRGGVIMVIKEPARKTYTIIKTLSSATVKSSMSRIVGMLNKEGLLLKFTAFDKTKQNVAVTI